MALARGYFPSYYLGLSDSSYVQRAEGGAGLRFQPIVSGLQLNCAVLT